MPQIITLLGGMQAILADPIPEPDEKWLRLQVLRPEPGVQWFRAYPITGGSMNVQESRIVHRREATKGDMDAALRACNGRNPASDAIAKLFARVAST